ncbi:actin bundling protein [Planoprotostelium fungivorum]|uniref:Actin bundling protein n=1 Tax=Planoprotostelium fungivorum TaxID=1890364 RepID=A0A2P6NZQ9_9EUKA|nr:actin bundling protein [Planoprotostelium fungivorum]
MDGNCTTEPIDPFSCDLLLLEVVTQSTPTARHDDLYGTHHKLYRLSCSQWMIENAGSSGMSATSVSASPSSGGSFLVTSNRAQDEAAERKRFSEYINMSTGATDQEDLWIDPSSEASLFEVVSQGVVLNRFINLRFPGKVNESKLSLKPKSPFEKTANNELTVAALRELGIKLVNIEANDLSKGTPTLVLGALWQLIKKTLLSSLDTTSVLSQLRDELSATGDTQLPQEEFTAEKALFSWANYHLKKSGRTDKKLTNFGADTEDGIIYAILLNRIAPQHMTTELLEEVLSSNDKLNRAKTVVEVAKKAFNSKFSVFVSPQDIVSGNGRLNFAFGLTLFNFYPILEAPVVSSSPVSSPNQGGRTKIGIVMVMHGQNDSLCTKGSIDWTSSGTIQLQVKRVNKEAKDGPFTTQLDRSQMQVIDCGVWDIGMIINAKSQANLGPLQLADAVIYLSGFDSEDKKANFKNFLGSCRRYPKKVT